MALERHVGQIWGTGEGISGGCPPHTPGRAPAVLVRKGERGHEQLANRNVLPTRPMSRAWAGLECVSTLTTQL